jgi:hypothetical protein
MRQGREILPRYRRGLRRRLRPLQIALFNGKLIDPKVHTMKQTLATPLKVALLFSLLALVAAPLAVQAQSGSAGGSIGNDDKQISGTRSAAPERPARSSRSADEPRRSASRRGGGGGGGGGGSFDGAWVLVGVGTNCQGSASGAFVVSNGRIIGDGIVSGSVSPSGAARSVSVGNGLTTTGTGHFSGSSASGSWTRSDGCAGRWSATKS